MSRVFLYKLTVDNGGAPCVTSDLLTLALCKPQVRSAANLGDWIFGFMDNPHDNRLVYIAEVTGKMSNGAYYDTKAFHARPDCIYRRMTNGRLEPKPKPRFHGSRKDMGKDIGEHPNYRKANVLKSTNFRYFGSTASKVLLAEHLAEFVRGVGQGHRSNTLRPLRRMLQQYRNDVWSRYPKVMKLGQPLHADDRAKCYGGKHEIC